MHKNAIYFFVVLFVLKFKIFADDCFENPPSLFNDLMVVEYWNNNVNYKYPMSYNHLYYGGYFNMPSARVGAPGEMGVGFSYVPPYHNYNLRLQPFERIELSLNYRVFRKMKDPILSKHGFGDFSDRGANIKWAIVRPEDSDYRFPGIAVGLEDFIGTRSFRAEYLVVTQVIPNFNLELSLGTGWDRIGNLFGGMQYIPFRQINNPYLQGLSLVAEYDATRYHSKRYERHRDGHVQKSKFNWGLKYQLWDRLDCSLSYVRGHKLAVSASATYDFGSKPGIAPKIYNANIYRAPTNTEPIGYLRPTSALAQDIVYAFCTQGFDVRQVWLCYDNCGKITLRIKMTNPIYWQECEVRKRVSHLLSNLVPQNIDFACVTIEDMGFSIQEYWFCVDFVRKFGSNQMGPYELAILSPLGEATQPNPKDSTLLFEKRRPLWNIALLPDNHFLFGSAKGKFKYSLGAQIGTYGYLYRDVYYSVFLGYNLYSRLYDLGDVDRLNPSQLINVRTDVIRYYQRKGITVDEGYLQKSWNLGRGYFTRISGGLFEPSYGGVATEVLRYPVGSNIAFGIEGAFLRKRSLSGVGFTDKIRKLEGFTPTYKKFLGSQYFATLYYDWKEAKIDFKIKAGKFLANDKGARLEVAKYYSSGLRVSFWFTPTNGKDKVNGSTYYDKGIAITMPLDFFTLKSCRRRWGHGMSAWLRDVGATSCTGYELFDVINDHRE